MVLRLLLATRMTPTVVAFQEVAQEVRLDVHAFSDVTAATRAARDERFDAIFVDATLPGLSREEFSAFLRKTKLNSQAPLVLLTGYDALEKPMRMGPEGSSWLLRPTREDLAPFLKALRDRLQGERRKHPRLSFRTSINCIQGSRRFQATSVNLSSVGVLLESASFLSKGEELELRFLLAADQPPFVARARVVRAEERNRVGTVFQDLNADARRRLKKFLDAHLPASR